MVTYKKAIEAFDKGKSARLVLKKKLTFRPAVIAYIGRKPNSHRLFVAMFHDDNCVGEHPVRDELKRSNKWVIE